MTLFSDESTYSFVDLVNSYSCESDFNVGIVRLPPTPSPINFHPPLNTEFQRSAYNLNDKPRQNSEKTRSFLFPIRRTKVYVTTEQRQASQHRSECETMGNPLNFT